MSSTKTSAPSESGRKGESRLRGVLIGAAVVLGLLAVAVVYLYLGAPGVVRGEILKTIAQRYHRSARLDRVRLDPLRLGAELYGFSLPDRDGRPMIAFTRLSANLSWPSLLLGRINFTDLSLDAPDVRLVRRADGRLNLVDLAPPPSKTETKAKPLALRIDHLRLTGGRTVLVDEMRPTPVERRFEKIAFHLRDFATTASGADFALSAQTSAGERLSWRGGFGMAPIASKGRFILTGWRADQLAALAPGALPVAVTSGLLDVSGVYDVALGERDVSLHLDIDQAILKSVALRPRGATSDPVRADALMVSGVHLDLAKHDVRIAHILLTGPDVTAFRSKSGVLSLMAFAPPPSPDRPQTGPAWTVSAPDIQLRQGRLAFEDRAARETAAWEATPIDVTVAGFAYPIAAPLQITAHMAMDDGSSLDARGSLTLPSAAGQSPVGAFDVGLAGLDLSRFQPYVSEAAKVSVEGGEASARGRIDLDPSGGVRFAGTVAVDDLQTIDPTLKSDLVTWDRVEATGVTAASKPFAVRVAKLRAKGAYGRVVLEPNYQINIRAVLEQPGAPPPGAAGLSLAPVKVAGPVKAASAPQPSALDLPIDIDRMEFQGGRMDFTDLTLTPHFSAGIEHLNGAITGFSARAGKRAKVDLKGDVGAFSPVVINGALAPFAPDRFLDMTMQFHNMELTTFSPYSGKFAGYRIDKGKLSLDLIYKIENEHLDASHHVVIDQLQLGDKVDSADAVKLPVKLIVALLKDKNGVIDLPIDVTGSLDDPKFKIWPVIWKVVGNLFGKIAAAPFTLLANLVGHGGDENLSHIHFEPGSAALAPAEAEKLATIAKAMDSRPALSLEIPEIAAPDLDRPALTDALYQEALQDAEHSVFKGKDAAAIAAALAKPHQKRRLLEVAYRQTLGARPPPFKRAPDDKTDPDVAAASALEADLRTHFRVSDVAVQALAQKRAEAVEAGLVQAGKVDPKRLFVVAAAPLSAGPIEMTLGVR